MEDPSDLPKTAVQCSIRTKCTTVQFTNDFPPVEIKQKFGVKSFFGRKLVPFGTFKRLLFEFPVVSLSVMKNTFL